MDKYLTSRKKQSIGLWRQRHLQYLKEYRRTTYTALLTSGKCLKMDFTKNK